MDSANEQVRSNVVRLVQPGTASSTRTSAQQKQDKAADKSWCNPKGIGIGRFRKELKGKGVEVSFSPTQPQGQQHIDSVSIEDVLEASPSLNDHFNRKRPELRQRSLDRRNT